MIRSLLSIGIALFLSVPAIGAELSLTLKPAKGLSGTHSITFHEDGNITILVYESPVSIVENGLKMTSDDAASLRRLATQTLDDYLASSSFTNLKPYPLTLGIAHTQDQVTKSISSRRLSAAAVRLINLIGEQVPEPYRLKVE